MRMHYTNVWITGRHVNFHFFFPQEINFINNVEWRNFLNNSTTILKSKRPTANFTSHDSKALPKKKKLSGSNSIGQILDLFFKDHRFESYKFQGHYMLV
jgi:hypothetical protein